MIKKTLFALFGLIAALILIVAAKTLFTTSKQLNIPPENPVTLDSGAASARLAAAVKLQTISSATDAEAGADAFKALHQHMLTSSPKLHAALKRELVGSYGLLYTWPGTDSAVKPIVEAQLSRVASTAAMLRTTTALTVINAGERDNVLPGRASASVNFRVLPGGTSDDVIKRTLLAVGDAPIKADKFPGFSEPSKISRTDAPGYAAIAKTIRQLHPDVIVAPSLMLGATDARYFDDVADNVYPFSPVRAGPNDLVRFHGTNERISVANYTEMIQFYYHLLRNVNAAASP